MWEWVSHESSFGILVAMKLSTLMRSIGDKGQFFSFNVDIYGRNDVLNKIPLSH